MMIKSQLFLVYVYYVLNLNMAAMTQHYDAATRYMLPNTHIRIFDNVGSAVN